LRKFETGTELLKDHKKDALESGKAHACWVVQEGEEGTKENGWERRMILRVRFYLIPTRADQGAAIRANSRLGGDYREDEKGEGEKGGNEQMEGGEKKRTKI